MTVTKSSDLALVIVKWLTTNDFSNDALIVTRCLLLAFAGLKTEGKNYSISATVFKIDVLINNSTNKTLLCVWTVY